jgi:hypothetical protein
MAFTDPLSITISAATSSLPRTDTSGNKAEYTSSDGLIKVTADHDISKDKRARRVLRVDHSKVTPNAFVPSENVRVSMSHYIVFDVPPAGYSAAEQLAVYTGFKAMYSASTDALITKLLGGES